jgi:polar amino acid transport system substrate-binding protein
VRALGRVTIAIDPSYPPFADYDAAGRVVGFDVDLSGEVAGGLGVAPELQAIDIASAIDALLARKVDLVISALPPYPEYTRDVAYSDPYFNAGQVLIVPAGSPITGPVGLAGRTLAVEQGSAGEEEGRKWTGTRLRLADAPEAALALIGNGAEAALLDRVVALNLTRGRAEWRVGEPLTFEPYVIAARRVDAALAAAVNQTLARLRADGGLAALERKWFY